MFKIILFIVFLTTLESCFCGPVMKPMESYLISSLTSKLIEKGEKFNFKKLIKDHEFEFFKSDTEMIFEYLEDLKKSQEILNRKFDFCNEKVRKKISGSTLLEQCNKQMYFQKYMEKVPIPEEGTSVSILLREYNKQDYIHKYMKKLNSFGGEESSSILLKEFEKKNYINQYMEKFNTFKGRKETLESWKSQKIENDNEKRLKEEMKEEELRSRNKGQKKNRNSNRGTNF